MAVEGLNCTLRKRMKVISVANCLRELLLYRRCVVKVVKLVQGDVRDVTIGGLSNNDGDSDATKASLKR